MADAMKLKTKIEKVKNRLKDKLKTVETSKTDTGIRRTKKTLKRLQRKLRLVAAINKKKEEAKEGAEGKISENPIKESKPDETAKKSE